LPSYYSTQYETAQGETWDLISIDFYNTPYYVADLIAANPQYSNVLIFEAGIMLNIPILDSAAPETLPPWKRGV